MGGNFSGPAMGQMNVCSQMMFNVTGHLGLRVSVTDSSAASNVSVTVSASTNMGGIMFTGGDPQAAPDPNVVYGKTAYAEGTAVIATIDAGQQIELNCKGDFYGQVRCDSNGDAEPGDRQLLCDD